MNADVFISRCSLVTVWSLLLASGGRADNPGNCAAHPAYAQLDFWLGEWDVFVAGRRVGANRIEKVLDGCAIVENWRDAAGSEGKSWFFYDPEAATWRQVWVTDRALQPGGVKQKALIAKLPDGSLQFQGSLRTPGGAQYLDRTTLRPMDHDEVQQRIETSIDGGRTWRISFDAVYRRHSAH